MLSFFLLKWEKLSMLQFDLFKTFLCFWLLFSLTPSYFSPILYKSTVLAGREKSVKANRYLRTAIRWFDNLLIICWARFLFLVLIIFWDLRCGDNSLSAAVFCLVSFALFFRNSVCSSIVIAAAASFSN